MDLSKYLPTPEMRADFENFKTMSSEERKAFQKERAKRFENCSPEEVAEFKEKTKDALIAIKEDLRDVRVQLEMDSTIPKDMPPAFQAPC